MSEREEGRPTTEPSPESSSPSPDHPLPSQETPEPTAETSHPDPYLTEPPPAEIVPEAATSAGSVLDEGWTELTNPPPVASPLESETTPAVGSNIDPGASETAATDVTDSVVAAKSTQHAEGPPSFPCLESFDEFELSEPLRRGIDGLGWAKPTPVQGSVFPAFAAGHDVLVQSHTGSGKTGAFCIPWLSRRFIDDDAAQTGVQLLVLLPTRELAKQVCDELTRLSSDTEVRVLPVYGGTAMGPQFDALERGVHAVVGTPGRILDHLRRRSLDLGKVTTVVLDECDEMLSMGFLEDIRDILNRCPKERQTCLFSATLPQDIVRIASRHMREPVRVELSGDQVAASEIEHVYYSANSPVKTRDLIDVLLIEDPATAIIFCNTREETNLVASVLQRAGLDAEALSSDLTQSARERVMGLMREHRLRFLVATDIAARGIDISHVGHVINYSFPEAAEVYVHRTGRTGRAGRRGTAISLVGPQEVGSFYQLKKVYPSLSFAERHLPPEADLAAQRKETRLDAISHRFPDLVSPEWIALARQLVADPRGERVIAFLLNQAMREAPRPRRTEDDDERDARTEDSDGYRSGRGPRRGDRRGDVRRDRRDDRRRDGAPSRSRTRETATTDRDDRRRPRLGRRDRWADEESRPTRRIEHEQGDERLTSAPVVADEAGGTAPVPTDERAADKLGSEGRRRSRGRRRGRSGERDPVHDARDDGPKSARVDGMAEGVATDVDQTTGSDEVTATSVAFDRDDNHGFISPDGTVYEDEPSDGSVGPELAAEAEPGDGDAGDGPSTSRRRRRRSRRRRRGESATESVNADARVEDETTPEASSESSDTGDRESDGSRRRSRSRRRGRGRPSQPANANVSDAPRAPSVRQDEILIDIDEAELEAVRSEFGEVDELDDLTVKGRRRGLIDELEDEVTLEDLSSRDARVDDKDSDHEDDDDDDDDDDDADDDASAITSATTSGETVAAAENSSPQASLSVSDAELRDESADPSVPRPAETDEASDADVRSDDGVNKKKRRRRRRKKKATPPPLPELTAPPHKDFWEVWAAKFTFKDFEADDYRDANAAREVPALPPDPVVERTSSSSATRRSRPAAALESSGTEEYVDVVLNIGRDHQYKAADVRALLRDQAGTRGRVVRDLTVHERSTTFRIDGALIDRVAEALAEHTIEGQALVLSRTEPSADESAGADPKAAANDLASTESAAGIASNDTESDEDPGTRPVGANDKAMASEVDPETAAPAVAAATGGAAATDVTTDADSAETPKKPRAKKRGRTRRTSKTTATAGDSTDADDTSPHGTDEVPTADDDPPAPKRSRGRTRRSRAAADTNDDPAPLASDDSTEESTIAPVSPSS